MDATAVAAIRTLYLTNGAAFLDIANGGRYPRADFFDTADHLNEEAQIRHSVAVAKALLQVTAALTDRTPASMP
jgi:hypothetical protein